MIPKKIHYCWFGGSPMPKLAEKCIGSWKKHCPDYEIIRWDESNFDVRSTPYTRWCHENQKWAFLSDYVRLAVIAREGGIYLDTDVELLRSPDTLLTYGAWYGFENETYVNTGQGFGAEEGHPTVDAMLQQYHNLQADSDGNFAPTACPALNTAALLPMGLIPNGKLQTVAGALILPPDYLNPYDNATGQLAVTSNTISIHHYAKSWISPWMRLRSALTRPLHRIFGKNCFVWLRKNP